MESFGKRVFCFAAFIVGVSTIIPIWSPGQQRLEYQVADNTQRLRELSNLPLKVALVEQRLAGIEASQVELKAAVSEINAKGWGLTAAFSLWAASQLFGLFGAKLRRKE